MIYIKWKDDNFFNAIFFHERIKQFSYIVINIPKEIFILLNNK